jgi:hypothetical protein
LVEVESMSHGDREAGWHLRPWVTMASQVPTGETDARVLLTMSLRTPTMNTLAQAGTDKIVGAPLWLRARATPNDDAEDRECAHTP